MNSQSIIRSCLVLMALIFVSACEKAPKLEKVSSGYTFTSPEESNVLRNTEEGNLEVGFQGNIHHDNMTIELNAEDIFDDGVATPYQYIVGLADVTRALQNGENTLYVRDNVTLVSETFTFFVDIVDPRIIVDKVTVTDTSEPFPGQIFEIEGRISDLTPVQSLKVTCLHDNGSLSLKEAKLSGEAPEQRFLVDFPCFYPDRSDRAYSPGNPVDPNATYNSDVHWMTTRADFTFVATGATGEEFTINMTVPESRYKKATEIQINESLFNNIEPYLKLSSQYLINTAQGTSYVTDYLSCIEGPCSLNNTRPVKGEVINFTANNLPFDINAFDDTQPAQNLVAAGSSICPTALFDVSAGQYCALYIRGIEIGTPGFDFKFVKGGDLARLDALATFNHLSIDVEVVAINSPSTLLLGAGSTANFDGSLNATIRFNKATLKVGMEILSGNAAQPNIDEDGNLFEFKRVVPVRIDQPFNYNQPFLDNVTCNVCTLQDKHIGYLTWLYDLKLMRVDGESIGSGLMDYIILGWDGLNSNFWKSKLSAEWGGIDDQIAGVVDSALAAVSTIIPKQAVSNVDQSSPEFDSTSPKRGIEVDLFAREITSVKPWYDLLGIGTFAARFSFDGSARAFYDNTCHNPGDSTETLTGSSHVGFPAITCENIDTPKTFAQDFLTDDGIDADWLMNSPAFNSGAQIDFAFSVSTNFINQYIQANHQTGFYEDYVTRMSRRHIPDDVITRYDLNTLSTDLNEPLEATFKTMTAPQIKMIAAQKRQQISVCGTLKIGTLPIDICDILGKRIYLVDVPEVKEQINIIADGVELTLTRPSNGKVLFKVNLDSTLYTRPTTMGLIAANERFADVIVNKVQVFMGRTLSEEESTSLSNIAMLEDILTGIFSEYAKNPQSVDPLTLLAGESLPINLIKAPVYTYDADDLPGIPLEDGACTDNVAATICYAWSDVLGDVMFNAGNGLLPIEVGVIFRALTVDKGGDQLLFALDFVTKDLRHADIQDDSCNDNGVVGNRVPSDPSYVASLCLR